MHNVRRRLLKRLSKIGLGPSRGLLIFIDLKDDVG